MDEFGAVMTAMSTVAIAYVITDYGFNLSATYKISRNRNNKRYINGLISIIFSAKIILIFFAIAAILIISSLPAYRDFSSIFLCGLGAVAFQAFQPTWLFQGIEKMKIFATYFSLTKILHVLFVYLIVKIPGDGYLVLVSWSLSNFMGLLISFYFVKKEKYKIRLSTAEKAWKEIKKTSDFFWSRLAIVAYTSASPIIIGAYSLQQAALYSTAEQGYKAGQAITSSIGQALYPYMAKEKNWKIFKKILILTSLSIILGSMIVGYFSEQIITIIFGSIYVDSATTLKIMLVTLFVNSLNILLGYPALSAINKIKWANKTVIIGSIFFIFLLSINIIFNKISSTSIAVTILSVETFILALRLQPLITNKKTNRK